MLVSGPKLESLQFTRGTYFADTIPYQEILQSWAPETFTDPRDLCTKPVELVVNQSFRFIVHTARLSDLREHRGIFSHDAPNVLTNADAICTSLFSDEKPFAFRDFGVVLRVPAQNILCAFHRDINSNLGAGALGHRPPVGRVEEQVWSYMARLPAQERNAILSENIKRFAKFLYTPDEVLADTRERHNEVVVATRPGVNIHPGFPATGQIEIAAYFALIDEPDPDIARSASEMGETVLTRTAKLKLFKDHVIPLARDFGLPALLMNGKATRMAD
jgi:hypothetical protein